MGFGLARASVIPGERLLPAQPEIQARETIVPKPTLAMGAWLKRRLTGLQVLPAFTN